jgi:hypothetical protein
MGSKCRVIQLCLLAMFAVGAVVTPAAFATEARPHWVVEGKELATGEKVDIAKVEGGPYKLTPEGLSTIECGQLAASTEHTSFIEGADSGVEYLVFKSCKVVGAPSCSVPNINTAPLDTENVYKETSGVKAIWTIVAPQERFVGGTFFTLKIEGKECPLKGAYLVTGSWIEERAPSGPGEEASKPKVKMTAVTGEFENPFTGKLETAGDFKFGAKKIVMVGESTVELAGGKHFGAV